MQSIVKKVEQLAATSHALARKHWQRALRIREKIRFSEEAFHLVLAGGVGVLGGLVNLCFYYATESVKYLFLRRTGAPEEVAEMMTHWWQILLTPTIGGLCAGLVLYWGLRLVGPQGSSNLLEVVVAGDGRLPFRSAIVKFISSLITIGSGGSIGREGGITQLSATVASKWGQIAHWPPYRLRLLVGCGAASGISAAYNAPISGAVFASLIVLNNFSMSLFAPLVFSSVVATMVSRSFFGITPWYTVPAVEFTSLTQLPWFLCLGLLTGAFGALFLKLLARSEELFKRLKAPIYVRLTLGGLAVGTLALNFPQVWGNGYISTDRILHGDYGSAHFTARDVINAEQLKAKLTDPGPNDRVSRYLAGELPIEAVNALTNSATSPRQLPQLIAEDLNQIIRTNSLYEYQRFAQVMLSRETLDLMKQKPKAGDLVRLNRLLILDAYPEELSGSGRYSKSTFALLFVTGLLLAKLLATLATVGSGAVGGVFTPTLFLGASLGAAFGLGLQQLGAGEGFTIAPFAVVGMGSMLAATIRSPLLAMIMVFELSLDYSLMPPLMLACVVSVLASRRLHAESIYTEPLRRKGVTVSQETTASESATEKTVADLMRAPVPPMRETSTISEIADRFLTSANNFLPVVDARNQLVGLIALHDLKEYLNAGDELKGVIAYDLMRPPPACVTPNQRLLDVLPVVLASEQRNIPVVNTLKENRLIGAIGRAEVLGIFSEAIAARNVNS
ncbi:MAG TPA: chloride channel protein [Candidatus Dormibacteraeota bacterium]|nr:chloride channel protein [Candidatus Dormibacteraeota bacterium]